MLSVSNSYFPGILKAAYGWYDYEISFQAKMSSNVPDERQNISFVVRSENSLNGILFQISKENFNPFLLYNETLIFDEERSSHLRTVLRPDVWIPVKIIVKGNNVDISVDNYHVEYRIVTKVFNAVENNLLVRGSAPTLRQIVDSNTRIQTMQSEIISKVTGIDSIVNEEEKRTAWAEVSADIAKIPPSTRVILEYQKGSVGFRQADVENTFFRNLTVKRI